MRQVSKYKGWSLIVISNQLSIGLRIFAGLVPLVVSAALPVAELDRESAVDFQTEILPIFNANCLACHNQTKAKAGLILETPETILEGGDSGPSVVAGDPGESILFEAAGHLDEDLIMPPVGNKSNAKDLSPDELALLRQWILEGATGVVDEGSSLQWQPLSRRVQPVYSMAMSPAGRYVAYGRGSQAALYELPSQTHSGRLIDPLLTGGQTHLDTVNSIAIHPEGRLIATGGFREVKLWEKAIWTEPLDLFDSTGARPTCLDVSLDRSFIVAGFESGEVHRWYLPTGKVVSTASSGHGPVSNLWGSPNGGQVAIIWGKKHVRVMRFNDDEENWQESTLASPVLESVWSRSGRRLAMRLENDSILVWKDLRNRGLEPELVEIDSGVSTLEFGSDNEDELILGFSGGGVKVVDASTGAVTREWETDSAVHQLALNEAGTTILVGTGDGHASLWRYAEGAKLRDLKGARPYQQAVAQGQRDLQLRTGDRELAEKNAKAVVEELKKEQERISKAETDQKTKQTAVDKANEALTAAQAAHEKAKQALAALDEKVSLAETALAQAKQASENAGMEAKALVGQLRVVQQEKETTPEAIDAINAQVDEALQQVAELAFATGEAKARLERVKGEVAGEKQSAQEAIDAAQKTLAAEEKKQADAKRAVGIAENELKLAQKSVARLHDRQKAADESVSLAKQAVEAAESQLEEKKNGLASALVPFFALEFSPTGDRVIAIGADGSVTSWWAHTGEALDFVPGSVEDLLAARSLTERTALLVGAATGASVVHFDSAWRLRETLGPEQGFSDRVNALDFSVDGSLLAAGGGDPSRTGEIKVWRLDSMELVHQLNEVHSDVVFGLRFSPDGKYLASASADRFARVVDLETGKTVHSLEGHTHYVMDVSWQANGRALVSAGADGMAKVWDVTTGERKKNIEGFKKEVTGVGFLGEGEEVLASSGDTTVAVYGLDGKKLRSMEDSQSFVFAESVSADGRFVAAGSQDGTLTVWDVPTGKVFTRVR